MRLLTVIFLALLTFACQQPSQEAASVEEYKVAEVMLGLENGTRIERVGDCEFCRLGVSKAEWAVSDSSVIKTRFEIAQQGNYQLDIVKRSQEFEHTIIESLALTPGEYYLYAPRMLVDDKVLRIIAQFDINSGPSEIKGVM